MTCSRCRTGFSYEVVAKSGTTEIHDGTGKVVGTTPERPDGTLVVAVDGGYRMIQNHEASPGSTQPVPQVHGTTYDAGVTGGGCTVLDVTRDGRRRSEWVGLSGTISNCAGGPTPWGSWLTCEESEARAGTVVSGQTLQQDHGYVFEVFADQPAQQVPRPIKAWGRFAARGGRRRARPDPGLPDRGRERPERALLPVDGTERLPAASAHRRGARPGRRHPRGARRAGPRRQRAARPGLRHRRADRPPVRDHLEERPRPAGRHDLGPQAAPGRHRHPLQEARGCLGRRRGRLLRGQLRVRASDLPADATKHDGQLWYYRYADQTLTLQAYFPYNEKLHAETPGWEDGLGRSLDLAFDGPDGCHVSPYGSLVLSEDGNTANHLLSWSRETGAQAIARNLVVLEQSSSGGNVYSEMTGPCFSPDGSVLFGNMQEPGHVFAIRGPWSTYLG